MNAGADRDDEKDAQVAPGDSPPSRKITLLSNRIDSRALFVGTREITIAHGGEIYRLRLTAQNKLILTK